MTREEIVRNLEYTMEKHKNDTVNTFGTNISVMCKDILDYLKQEQTDVLDKIRAEIEDMPSELTEDCRRMVRQGSVFRIIDKYRKEDTNAD